MTNVSVITGTMHNKVHERLQFGDGWLREVDSEFGDAHVITQSRKSFRTPFTMLLHPYRSSNHKFVIHPTNITSLIDLTQFSCCKAFGFFRPQKLPPPK